jgi:hypothetical protein
MDVSTNGVASYFIYDLDFVRLLTLWLSDRLILIRKSEIL